MKRNVLKYIVPVVAAALAVMAVVAAKPDYNSRAARLKADYIYLQASLAEINDDIDDYVLMASRAARLNPSDLEITGDIGLFNVVTGVSDSATFELNYKNLRDRFVTNPRNYYFGLQLEGIARKLGRYDDVLMVWSKLDSAFPTRTDPARRLAVTYLEKFSRGDTSAFSPAMAILDRLEGAVGIDPEIVRYKIAAYNLRRDTAAMLAEVQRLYRSAPANAEIALYTGSYFDALEMPDSALVYFDRAVELDSLNGAIYLTRAEFFEQRGDSVAYDREVFRALVSPTLDFEPKFRLLTGYVRSLFEDPQQQERIESMFEVLEEVNPGEASLHHLYGAYFAAIERPAMAAEQFTYAVALNPDNPDLWRMLIQTELEIDEYGEAIRLGNEAMERFPQTLLFPLLLSNAYMLSDRQLEGAKAIKGFDVSTFNNPEAVSQFYGNIADLYYAGGEPDSALVYYERALQVNPTNYMAMNNAAYYMAETPGSDLDLAERYSSMAVRSDPKSDTFLDTYAWVMFRKGDFEAAREVIDRILVNHGLEGPPHLWEDPDKSVLEEISDVILDHAGDIYYMCGDKEDAVALWHAAYGINPDSEAMQKKANSGKIDP